MAARVCSDDTSLRQHQLLQDIPVTMCKERRNFKDACTNCQQVAESSALMKLIMLALLIMCVQKLWSGTKQDKMMQASHSMACRLGCHELALVVIPPTTSAGLPLKLKTPWLLVANRTLPGWLLPNLSADELRSCSRPDAICILPVRTS